MENITPLEAAQLGGIERVYFVEHRQVVTVPPIVNGTLFAALELVRGATFHVLDGTHYTKALDAEASDGPHGTSYKQTVSGLYAGDSADIAGRLARMNGKRYLVLLRYYNGAVVALGDALGGLLFTFKFVSGTAPATRKGYAWQFEGVTSQPAAYLTDGFDVEGVGLVQPQQDPNTVTVQSPAGTTVAVASPGTTVVVPLPPLPQNTFAALTDPPRSNMALAVLLDAKQRTPIVATAQGLLQEFAGNQADPPAPPPPGQVYVVTDGGVDVNGAPCAVIGTFTPPPDLVAGPWAMEMAVVPTMPGTWHYDLAANQAVPAIAHGQAPLLPVPQLELRHQGHLSNLNPVGFYTPTQVRVKFDGPLPAAINPEIWLFVYNRRRKKAGQELHDALTNRLNSYNQVRLAAAAAPLTPTEQARWLALNFFFLNRVPGFTYLAYADRAADPLGWDQTTDINFLLVNDFRDDHVPLGSGAWVRQASWGHPAHHTARHGPAFWAGGAGNVYGRSTEFFGQALQTALAQKGYFTLDFNPGEWFYGTGHPSGKANGAKAVRFRFALVVDAPAGQGRGGKYFSALSDTLLVSLANDRQVRAGTQRRLDCRLVFNQPAH